MRLIGAVSHGIIDYLMVVILIAGPSFAGFTGRQEKYAYLLAAIMFTISVLTRYPLGVIRGLRFVLHGAVEFVLAILILILPWLANFSRGIHSRNFFVFVALIMLAIWLMTDFRGLRDRSGDREAVQE
jgi:hypothetical protein